MEPFVPAFEKLGVVAQRAGSRLPDATPNNLYATKDQEFIHITAFSDPVFTRLCEAMGQPGLSEDERFKSARIRNDHADEIDDAFFAEVFDGTRVGGVGYATVFQ